MITDGETIRKILEHIGEAHAPPRVPMPRVARVVPIERAKPRSLPAPTLPWSEGESYPEEWFS